MTRPVTARAPWPGPVQHIEVDRAARIRAAVWGEGPPLLLINGIGAHLEMWEPFATHLTGRTVIVFDAPGTGDSARLRRPVRMRRLAGLVERLLDNLGVEQCDVLGYSWGGALAQQLTHQAPKRVRRLVLVSTTPGAGGQPPAAEVIRMMLSPRRYTSHAFFLQSAPRLYGGKARDPSPAFARHTLGWTRKPPTPGGYAHQMYAISGWSSLPWLHRVRQPILVLCGDDDPLVPVRNARILARRARNAQLHVVPGAGHLILFEDPAAWATRILRFLDAEPAVGAGAG